MKNTRISKFKCAAALQALSIMGAGLVVSTVVATPLMAQDYTNVSASGRVIGTDGNAIAGATVEITSNDQGFKRTTTTDSSGSYRVAQIPAGDYTFTISAEGYETFSDAGVRLNQGGSANQFTLASSTAGGEIVVTAGRVQVVDFERTTTGAVVDVEDLATRVPVGRDITSIVLLAPGTTEGDSAFGSLPNINGASVAENAYYINGLNITQFRQGLGAVTVPFDFYKTVEVKSGAYPAEFGRSTGGIINAVTKSGTNEWHGGLTVNFQPDALSVDAPNTLFSDNDRDYFQRTDVTAELGGPLIKDRVFVYGLYSARDVTNEFATTAPAGGPATFTINGSRFERDRTRSPFYGGKIDIIPIDGHRFEGTYFNTSQVTYRSLFGGSAAGRYNPITNAIGVGGPSTLFRSGGENYVGRYTGNFTDWLTISAAYGKNKQTSTTEAADTTAPSVIDARTGRGNAQIGNPTANSSFNYDEREFYRADVDVNFSLFGEHHIRGGYDNEKLSANAATRANGDYQLTIGTGTAATLRSFGIAPGTEFVTSRFFLNGGVFTSENEAFYIQDNWALFDSRLNLQLGIRNDRFQNANAAGTVFYKSGDQWGPRLGASFDVFGDNRTKVFANFGRYFLPVAGNTNIRLAGSELDYDRYNLFGGFDANGRPIIGAPIAIINPRPCPDTNGPNCRIRSDGQPADTETTVAKNLKSQSLDEYIFGVEQKLGGNWRVGINYTRTRLNDALEDAAIDPAVRAYCASIGNTACANIATSTWSGTHQYVLINPGRDSIVTLSDPLPGETTLRTITLTAADLKYPKASRKYDAVTLKVDRDFDGVWSLSGSYTYTKLRGNYEGGVKSDNGQTDTGLTTDFDLPGLTVGSNGPSPNERRHNFKLYGSFAVTDWFSIGANVQVTSPRKFGCIGTVNPTVDQDAFDFYGANGNFCNLDSAGNVIIDPATPVTTANLKETPRGSQFQSDWSKNVNLDLNFRVPTDVFEGFFRVSIFNLLNSKAELDFIEQGTTGSGLPRATYGQVTQYQSPRAVRLQFGVKF